MRDLDGFLYLCCDRTCVTFGVAGSEKNLVGGDYKMGIVHYCRMPLFRAMAFRRPAEISPRTLYPFLMMRLRLCMVVLGYRLFSLAKVGNGGSEDLRF